MNTIENNKLIAEFMGEVKTFDVVDNDTYHGEITLSKGLTEEQIEGEISHFEDRYSVTPIAIEEPLQYHTSWGWLMPVVENIESLGYEFFIVENRVKVAHNTDHSIETIIDFTFDGGKKGATYQGVVEFIKEYNKKKEEQL